MIASLHIAPQDVYTGLGKLARANPDQAGPCLVGYYLIRGFNWADSTSIQEAAILVDEVQDHCPELAGEVRSYLMRRARLNGPDWSVADVQRPQWWRRRQYGWDEALPLWDWPGGRAWQDLRLHHLSAQGWEADEIATVFQLRVRGIRERLRDLKADGVAGAELPPVNGLWSALTGRG